MRMHRISIFLGVALALLFTCESKEITCDNVRCAEGTHCVLVRKHEREEYYGYYAEGPVCVNDTSESQMSCVGPNKLKCPKPTEECVLREVVCIRAPCPPMPMCVCKASQSETCCTICAATLCPMGTVCFETVGGCGECVEAAFCEPGAVVTCAAVTCPTNTSCKTENSCAVCRRITNNPVEH